MGTGDEDVELALPQPHLDLHVLELEAPGSDEGEIVVDPAARALSDRLDPAGTDGCSILGSLEQSLIRFGELGRELVEKNVGIAAQRVEVGREEGFECFFSFACRRELADVQIRHPDQEIEAGVVGRPAADECRGAGDTLGQKRRAGQGVRSPTGDAEDGEAVDAERVGQILDIDRARRDRAARLRVRAAVARPVAGDDQQALVDARVGMARQPAARRAVEVEDGGCVRLAVLDVGKHAAIARLDRALPLHGRRLQKVIPPKMQGVSQLHFGGVSGRGATG